MHGHHSETHNYWPACARKGLAAPRRPSLVVQKIHRLEVGVANHRQARARGKELADHQRLTLATEVDVFFCDPRCPWQRGSNENTNRLLRQYLPRGTDLSLHSQAKLSAIARQLNERPRKTLLYQTPAEKFAECVAAIGCPAAKGGHPYWGMNVLPDGPTPVT